MTTMTRYLSITGKPKLTRSEAGRLGALARHRKSSEELDKINKKIVATRLQNNPYAFRDMAAQGGGRKRRLSNSEIVPCGTIY